MVVKVEFLQRTIMRIFLTLFIALLWMTVVNAQSDRSLIREGNQMYKKDKYSDAEVSYRKALEKNKELKQGAFNLGDALYKQERYGEAAEQYRIAAQNHKDAETKSPSAYDPGLVRTMKSSRRFCFQADSSWPWAAGLSFP